MGPLLALGIAVTTLSYGADPAQRLDLYVDAHASEGRSKPVVVFFHGGVWQHGGRRDGARLAEALARRGFVVAVAGYRLTPRARWPDEAEDAAAAVDVALDAAAHVGGDPRRLILAGHSAGAQMAAMLAYDPRFLAARGRSVRDIRALALLSGVFSLAQPLDEGQPDGGFRAFVAPTFGDDPRALGAASPLTVARPLGIPFVCVTAEHDYRAMRAQTAAFERKLRALGETVTHLDVPGVDHTGIVDAPQTADAVARLALTPPAAAARRPPR